MDIATPASRLIAAFATCAPWRAQPNAIAIDHRRRRGLRSGSSRLLALLCLCACTGLVWGCSGAVLRDAPPGDGRGFATSTLETLYTSSRLWTGIAVREDGRIFVNYPRWSDDVPVSVAEIVGNRPEPFPNADWNRWVPGANPEFRWVAVQSVVLDRRGRLWVLDTGNPHFAGVIDGAPKLVAFDPDTREVLQIVRFSSPAIRSGSYLNDVRIDIEGNRAYLTDSGDGALVIVDLDSHTAWRVLDNHAATQAEDIDVTIDGEVWRVGGESPRVHADGLAISESTGYLYFQALTARTLYRVHLNALRVPGPTDAAIIGHIEVVADIGPSDGLLAGEDGSIYVTSLEMGAIRAIRPNGRVEIVARHRDISWPDSMSWGPGGLWFTTAQIHRAPEERGRFGIHRLNINRTTGYPARR